MEITFKIVLDKRHCKKDETYPLKLRVFQNRVFKECSLNIDVPESQWDANMSLVLTTNVSFAVYNAQLASTRAKIQRLIFLSDDAQEAATPTSIINQLKNKGQKQVEKIKPKTDIFNYGKQHVAQLQVAGRIGNGIVFSSAISKLKAYTKLDKLPFESITYKYLEEFNSTLRSEGTKINSISNYLRSVRVLFNKAIKEGVVEAKSYPFTHFKIKSERTVNRTLTRVEMSSILSLELKPHSTIWHNRNLFVLSYCLIGINFFDLLTLTRDNLIDGRIVFRRKKTHKIYSIKIQPKAKEILDCYCADLPNCSKQYILPFVTNKNNLVTLKADVQQAIKNTNDYLLKMATQCKISKNVTTYYGRYTWANLARELGHSKDMIAEALGHEYGNKVTGIYLDNYDNELIDAMNEKVIEAVSINTTQSTTLIPNMCI